MITVPEAILNGTETSCRGSTEWIIPNCNLCKYNPDGERGGRRHGERRIYSIFPVNSISGGPFEPAYVCVTNMFVRSQNCPAIQGTILMDFNWLFNVRGGLKGAFYQVRRKRAPDPLVFIKPRIRDAPRPISCPPPCLAPPTRRNVKNSHAGAGSVVLQTAPLYRETKIKSGGRVR